MPVFQKKSPALWVGKSQEYALTLVLKCSLGVISGGEYLQAVISLTAAPFLPSLHFPSKVNMDLYYVSPPKFVTALLWPVGYAFINKDMSVAHQ